MHTRQTRTTAAGVSRST